MRIFSLKNKNFVKYNLCFCEMLCRRILDIMRFRTMFITYLPLAQVCNIVLVLPKNMLQKYFLFGRLYIAWLKIY